MIFTLNRKIIFRKFKKNINKKNNQKNNFIEGEYEDIDDDHDKKI